MLGFPSDPVFFPSIDLLNTVRNSVAHRLAIDREKIDDLVRINSEGPYTARGLTDGERATALKQITRFLCGQMLGVIEGMHAVEWVMNQEGGEKSS